MRLFVFLLGVIFALAASQLLAANVDFDGLKCGDDIAKSIKGRRFSRTQLEKLEKKYASLKLKNQGSDEGENGLALESWTMCESTYLILVRKNTAIDALKIEGLSQNSSALCKHGKGSKSSKELLIFKSGDKITDAVFADYTHAKLTKEDTKDLVCEVNDGPG